MAPKRPPPPDPDEDNSGPSTLYVRMDPSGNPVDQDAPHDEPTQPGRGGSAPKKGLQVRLPDDDEPPPPPPKKKAAPEPAAGPKGRRGQWWDNKTDPHAEEPSPDDAPGATAFLSVDKAPPPDDEPGATAILKIDKPPPPPPRRRAAPRVEEPEPEPEPEERPTVQRRKKAEPPPDDASTRMLDIRNLPSPEEIRQQAAKAAAASKKQDPAEPAEGGWTAARVTAILITLGVVLALVAVVLWFVLR